MAKFFIILFFLSGMLEVPAAEVRDSKRLYGFMEHLRSRALTGANVEYFDYAEEFDFRKEESDRCRVVTAKTVSKEFRKIAETIELDSDEGSFKVLKDNEPAFQDFERLVSGRRYEMCLRIEQEFYSVTELTYFMSIRTHDPYQILFTVGMED